MNRTQRMFLARCVKERVPAFNIIECYIITLLYYTTNHIITTFYCFLKEAEFDWDSKMQGNYRLLKRMANKD